MSNTLTHSEAATRPACGSFSASGLRARGTFLHFSLRSWRAWRSRSVAAASMHSRRNDASATQGMQQLPVELVERVTFNGSLVEAARYSGLEDQQIAEQIHICAGYMSRFMRGVAQQWAKRLVLFMRVTRSLAPLQWIADQMGCDVVPRDSRAAEVAALRARLQELQGASAA